MVFFNKFIASHADEIIVKLMKYRDFPEEQYAVSIENRKLKDEIVSLKSARYEELVQENKRIRQEIEVLTQEKMERLELENKILRLEIANPTGSNANRLLLGNSIEKSEIVPSDISRFMYISGVFKYGNDYSTMHTVKITDDKFSQIVKEIFPDGDITITENKIHMQISNYDGAYIDRKVLDTTNIVEVDAVDDWIESRIKLRKQLRPKPEYTYDATFQ